MTLHARKILGLGGSDGAVVIDLKHFQHFSMDSSTYIATIGAGTLLGDVTTRLHDAGGRAMAHGTCPQVGAGGHFTIGGLGPTSRQWGMALDHIEEVEVVLANSSIVRASGTQNPDILFAVKGAASSFGVVTEFKVRTHPEPGHAVQYSYTFDFGNTTAKARLFSDWQTFVSDPDLTRNLATVLTVFEGGMVISGTFFGSKTEFDKFKLDQRFPGSNPRNNSAIVLDDWLGMLENEAENLILEVGGSVPNSFYAKSLPFTPETLISSSGVEDLFEYLDTTDKGTPTWFVIFDLNGGAINDYPVNTTAYAHRDTLFWMQSYAINLLGPVSNTTVDFLDGINKVIGSAVPGVVRSGAYPGYVDPFLNRPQSQYWGSNLERLQEIKARVDPGDVFHNPQSVGVAGR